MLPKHLAYSQVTPVHHGLSAGSGCEALTSPLAIAAPLRWPNSALPKRERSTEMSLIVLWALSDAAIAVSPAGRHP